MNKTVLITGSSSGIGLATAQYFKKQGWNVAATMRTPSKSNLKESKSLKLYKLDVTNKKSIKSSIKKVIKDFGQIDVVVNNAGYGAFGVFEKATDKQIKRQFGVNVFGLLDVTREVLPHFRKNKSGLFINISSMGGRLTTPTGSMYHGTKFAVEGLSECLNYELNMLGIKVKLVEPGLIDTDFAGRSMDIFENKNLKDYDELEAKLIEARKNIKTIKASKPKLVAKVIYTAATDNKDKLRYIAGNDAKIYLFINKWFGPKVFGKIIKTIFKI